MPRRDPQTGKFVSGGDSGVSYDELETAIGAVDLEIPAADLSGGQTTERFDGAEIELMDFGDLINRHDQSIEIVEAVFDAELTAHTTQTAESFVGVGFSVREEPERDAWSRDPVFFSGAQFETGDDAGIVDGRALSARYAGTIWGALLQATGNIGDSTNGLGAGSDFARESERVQFVPRYDRGPVYDESDDWYVSGEFFVDNASDHAVEMNLRTQVWGRVVEDC